MTKQSPLPATLSEAQRVQALERFAILRPALEEGVPQTQIARLHDLPLSTVQRWIKRYRERGLAGLAHQQRSDRGKPRSMPSELVQVIEELALQRPSRSVTAIHHRLAEIARQHGCKPLSYSRVYQIVSSARKLCDLEPPKCFIKSGEGQHITTRCHRMARKVITMKSIAIRSDNYKKFASFNCKEIASFNSKMGIIEMIFLDSFLRKTYNFGSYLQICEAQSDSIAEIQPRKQYIAQRGLRSDSPEGPKDEGNLMVTLLPFGQEVNMKSGFHSATTTTADLQTDVTASAHAGFKTLELWLAKVDRFPLKIFPFIYACLKLFMHVSNILAMMAPIPSNYFAPNIGLGILCN